MRGWRTDGLAGPIPWAFQHECLACLGPQAHQEPSQQPPQGQRGSKIRLRTRSIRPRGLQSASKRLATGISHRKGQQQAHQKTGLLTSLPEGSSLLIGPPPAAQEWKRSQTCCVMCLPIVCLRPVRRTLGLGREARRKSEFRFGGSFSRWPVDYEPRKHFYQQTEQFTVNFSLWPLSTNKRFSGKGKALPSAPKQFHQQKPATCRSAPG